MVLTIFSGLGTVSRYAQYGQAHVAVLQSHNGERGGSVILANTEDVYTIDLCKSEGVLLPHSQGSSSCVRMGLIEIRFVAPKKAPSSWAGSGSPSTPTPAISLMCRERYHAVVVTMGPTCAAFTLVQRAQQDDQHKERRRHVEISRNAAEIHTHPESDMRKTTRLNEIVGRVSFLIDTFFFPFLIDTD